MNKTIASIQTQETATKAGNYVLTRSVILRVTGFPIELVESLAAPELAEVADQCRVTRQNVILQLQRLLSSSPELSRSMRRKIKRCCMHLKSNRENLVIAGGEVGDKIEELNRALAGEAEMQRRAAHFYDQELERTRRLLYQFVMGRPFQEVLLLSSPELARFTPTDANPPAVRNSHIRQRELSWISYLQRLTTKNETISFFGPCAWGEFDPHEPAAAVVQLSEQRIRKRVVYVERWVCESLAQLISSDREAQPLLRLRLPDDLVLQEDRVILLSTGKTILISSAQKEFLESCNVSEQRSPGSSLAEELVEQGLLVRKLEVPATPLPFRDLQREVESWPVHPARGRWRTNLEEIDKCRERIEHAACFEDRHSAMQAMTSLLRQLGVDSSRHSKELYASRLPVNEDCQLGVERLALGKPVMDQLLNDATPWCDLWRDLAGLYASRMYQCAQERFRSGGSKPIPLAAFWPTLIQTLGHLSSLENEIQQAWDKQLGERWRQPLASLTREDLAFVRNNFFLRRMKAFDNLSPDLQIVAPDAQALSQGRWSLLIAELHPDFSAWQHCFFIWCPDPESFAADYAHQGGQGAAAIIGNYPPYFTSAHTALWVHPFAHRWKFVGVCGPEGVQRSRSAEVMVEVTEDDVVLRHTNGQMLGSILHTWNTAVNTHRLELRGNSNHSPRLQVGRVIVQRETWSLEPDSVLRQAALAGGHKAYAGWREFRQKHGLPEKVFIRGCMTQRLTFDKDIKPVFVDFRSPLLLEMASKMVNRFQKLSITEMLPATEACWLEGNDGHYSSEFRTVILASRDSRDA
jgi:Lantibiotic dehydratase, N terminus